MSHKVSIGGREVVLEWSNETAKRFAYRMGEIGGEPTSAQLSNRRTVTTALFKVLWGLLPPGEFARHESPEALYVAVDHDSEAKGIFDAIAAVYAERFPTPEKKRSSRKSPSRKSS
jgi:hypothetical protein